MTEFDGSPDDKVGVDSAADFLDQTELSEIRTYVLVAERRDSQDAEPARVAVSVRTDPRWLETRCRLTLTAEDATFIVDRSAVFTHRTAVTATDEATREFVEKVGVMSVYPYLREGVYTLAGNLGVSPPVMALILGWPDPSRSGTDRS